MVIEERPVDDPGLSALLGAAFAELVARYGPEGRSAVHEEARYLVASVDGVAVGCGAVQPAGPSVGELKRMFVLPDYRGRGIARKLVVALEDLAGAMGCHTLLLATGVRQPEAIALYERCGYVPVERYGKYVDQPLTRCFHKPLPEGTTAGAWSS
ncbi:GNAT family N-acetyltransferase [Microlunatus sp. GCM10028923]|uniref:GNAT family N-acetyltransferase n=1 Tax=Microlunatus sp. GCM10028923 TaxID=3273400 RepID=UPI00361CE36E